jgi:hypothetical protein
MTESVSRPPFPRLFPILALLALLLPAALQAQPFGGYLELTGNATAGVGHGFVQVPHSADLHPTDAITIEFWVNLREAGDCRSLIGKNYRQTYYVNVCGTTLRSYLRGDGSLKEGGEVPTQVWTHVAVVYDGSTRRHYINGVQVASFPQTGTLTSNTGPLRIGSDVSYEFTPRAWIDEVRIWSVARTAAQIQSAMRTAISTPMAGLVAVWSFDGNAQDVVGGHDGTTVGTATFGPPPVPAGPWLSSGEVPGFRFKVRLTTGGTSRMGTQVEDCVEQTVCVAGVFPDRPEVLLRVVGPRSNGYLWPIVVRFTNSQVEVWVEQVSTGEQKYYRLEFVGPESGELPGVNDRFGFLP